MAARSSASVAERVLGWVLECVVKWMGWHVHNIARGYQHTQGWWWAIVSRTPRQPLEHKSLQVPQLEPRLIQRRAL